MTVQHSLIKLDATIKLAQEFSASSFPHEDSTIAVKQLLGQLDLVREKLRDAKTDDLVKAAQHQAASMISDALETLGIIANSANVRNAFEVHGPVLELARKLLANIEVRLILTFEWKYMPYALPVVPGNIMKDVVVIGLPASEASNALVLPMVGHELGHLLWDSKKMTDSITTLVTKTARELSETTSVRGHAEAVSSGATGKSEFDQLIDLSSAVDWSIRQLEEIYCDFAGLYIFGQSYLECFEYMLDPPPMEQRDPEYPSIRTRARYLQDHGPTDRVARAGFFEKFAEQENPFEHGTADRFALGLADAVTDKLAPQISDMLIKACQRTIAFASSREVEGVAKRFLEGVPAEQAGSLDAILNGGWSTFKSGDFMPTEAGEVRIAALNELILKTIEILEIEKIMSDAAQA
jgi:hypothetical protein